MTSVIFQHSILISFTVLYFFLKLQFRGIHQYGLIQNLGLYFLHHYTVFFSNKKSQFDLNILTVFLFYAISHYMTHQYSPTLPTCLSEKQDSILKKGFEMHVYVEVVLFSKCFFTCHSSVKVVMHPTLMTSRQTDRMAFLLSIPQESFFCSLWQVLNKHTHLYTCSE